MDQSIKANAWTGLQGPSVPVSVVSAWQSLHDAPHVADADHRNGSAVAAANPQHVLQVGGLGTALLVRYVYLAADEPTGPLVRVHAGTGDHWHALRDRDGDRDVTFVVNLASDDQLGDGEQATLPVFMDVEGADRVVVSVGAAASHGGRIEVKVL